MSLTKSNLCALLQTEKIKPSVDIKGRFVSQKKIILQNLTQNENAWRDEVITRGDWIAISYDSQYLIGRVLNFQYHGARTKKDKFFAGDSINIKIPKDQNVFFLLEPLFKIQRRKLVITNIHEYFDI